VFCDCGSVALACWLGMKLVYLLLADRFLALNLKSLILTSMVDFLGAFVAILA